ncbi:putative aspartate aminotransferase, cytoplasmic 2 isoform X2 [Microcaecilia unicolor]|uniref:aspartate transaminase n=1 Tax=Microcaecilia unicolor TaxID=1415580 RepID=A0A6P7XSK3_9AMPH|nr:putative aspartate aminotransferase, cytoplasmic 2 isoform X2 [Microcaecilia unicolor]
MSALSAFSETLKASCMPRDQPLEGFIQDKDSTKIFLGHRDFRADNGLPWVAPVIKMTQLNISSDPTLHHDYLPALGLSEFTRVATELAIGKDSIALLENRAGGIQTPGGTGALWLGARFLRQWYNDTILKPTAVYVSFPAWDTHQCIFQDAGFTDIRSYTYWDNRLLGLDMKELLFELKDAPENSIVLLHASPHNPTGMDLTPEEWTQLASVMQKKKLFPFFHLSAQGLASGDLDKDALPLRLFITQGFELFCAQSFSKNFGLYDDNVGNLIVITKNNKTLINIRSQLDLIVKVTWLNPPNLGARIVTTVLNNPTLFNDWKRSIRMMAKHLMLNRKNLKDKLRALGTLGTWDHITKQTGIYSFSGLSASQVEFLHIHRHVHLGANGQINMSSLNSMNLDYVAHSIHEAVNSVA